MEFGNWELRDDSYYYFAKDAQVFPSSNALDEGKLTTEENLRNIYRDIFDKNFVLKYNHFALAVNANRTAVTISPGEAVINGYRFVTKNSIEIKVPDNRIMNDDGTYSSGIISQYTLGISISYDASNHILGDVVNKEAHVGESEILSGIYLKWFDDCQLECNYDNILILGRAWVQNGSIVRDGTQFGDRIIYHGFEQDPLKNHKYSGDSVEIDVYGHKTTKYDTLRDNMSQIHTSLYSYDTAHNPIELNRGQRTKPASHTTDLQDYISHIPDWLVSKYGDYMTGALRFNNLSIDALREYFDEYDYIKDGTHDNFQDSVLISPRTYGDLVRDNNASVKNNNFDYNVGGTIMTIVPGTYKHTTDFNYGYTGIHAALISQKYGDTGLRIHSGDSVTDNNISNYTRMVHYNENDSGLIYDKEKTDNVNSSKFIIENSDNSNRKSSINFKNGEIFIDSYNDKVSDNTKFIDNEDEFEGFHYGSGIQLFSASKNGRNIDFRVDNNVISMADHAYEAHRTGTRGTQQLGNTNDTLHFTLGIGKNAWHNYHNNLIGGYTDPYLTLGNLRIKSTSLGNESNVKLNTIEILNEGDNNNKISYINVQPGIYTSKSIVEKSIQIGTEKENDFINNNAELNTNHKLLLKSKDIYTYLEQTVDNISVFNKMSTPISGHEFPTYKEIAGIVSAGNIGCSDLLSTNDDISDSYNAYTDDKEWVRFTKFRYDNDKDVTNGGSYDEEHDKNDGRKLGSTYNIEFNTTVANQRANQIIWRYNGSVGKTNSETLENTPPVVLSYVHDNMNSDQGLATKYSNVDNNGVFETYMDHNGYTHYNPTNKIRDFLLLENAGLSISGDINNPSLVGDGLNANNHLGVTICHGRVYNAVYNDFAETFEKDNIEEIATPGTLIALNPETGKYTICDGFENKLVVGVQSNSYAFLAGGNRINKSQDIIDLQNEYFTVAVVGKVWVNVVENSNIRPGDMLTSSIEKGKATKSVYNTMGTMIGKALCEPKYFEEDNQYKVLALIMTQ